MTFASMDGAPIAMWMVFSLLISAVIVLAAIAAHDAQRAAKRPVRWVWAAATVAIVGFSIAAPFRTPTTANVAMPIASIETVPVTDAISTLPTVWQWISTSWAAVVPPVQVALGHVNQALIRAPAYTGIVLATAWLIASLAVSIMLLLSYQRMGRRVRSFPLSKVDDVPVRLSSGVGPAVVGLAPSQIVIPSWLTTRSPAEQRMVVAHEAEHIRAFDPWILALACVAVSIMPWNAALWYALSRLRLAIEIDCDHRVLQGGVHAETYGSLLIDMTAIRPLLPIAMPGFPGTHSHLERRILAMTQRPARFMTARRAAGALLATAIFVTACESTLPTAAEVETMDVASAQQQAAKAGLVDTTRVLYIVNGVQTKESTAREIAASDIASIEVAKAGKSGVNEVRILKKDTTVGPTVVVGKEITPLQTVVLRKAPMDSADGSKRPLTVVDGVVLGTPRNPLLVIDGVISPTQNLQALKLSPNTIESVKVIKGAAAMEAYSDPRAQNGVIVITTKK